MILNWEDIIKNKKYQVIKEIKKGMTNNKYLISVNGEKYLISTPKSKFKDKINYKILFNNFRTIAQNLDMVRKCLYWDKKETFVYSYVDKAWDCTNLEINVNELATLINKLQEIKITGPKINWIEVCYYYFNNALMYNFNYEVDLIKKLLSKLEEIDFLPTNLVFAHGDLFAENILFKPLENKYYLIDFEFCCLTSPYFDIAYFAYYQNLDEKQIKVLLENNNHDLLYLEFKKYYYLINILSICWAANDFSISKNLSSKKQLLNGIKKAKGVD